MLIGEPPRTQGDLHFRLLGIPVRVHPFFWLVAVLMGMSASNAVYLLAWVIALFLSILIHEFGHAMAMRRFGLDPWITLYGLGGVASYNQSRSYGSRPPDWLGQIFIAAAGPGAGFLLGGLILLVIAGLGYQVEVTFGGTYGLWIRTDHFGPPAIEMLVRNMLFISIVWGLVNLLPVYPLDGGQIARELLLKMNPQTGIRQSLILSILAGSGMAAVGLLKWNSWWVALLFGYLAYSSYGTLLAYSGRGRHW